MLLFFAVISGVSCLAPSLDLPVCTRVCWYFALMFVSVLVRYRRHHCGAG